MGIVVKDLDRELESYHRLFGVKPSTVKLAMDGRLRVAFIPVGDGEIELLQPLDPSILFGRFLQTHGQGIHHIALETDDIEAEVERLRKEGVTFDTLNPRVGAHGVKIIFTEPQTTGDIAVEICEMSHR